MKYTALFILLGLLACSNAPEVQNCMEIQPNDSMNDILHKAVSIVPTPQQYAWQKNEFIAFVHFGINTFTGREWGTGMEDPKIFDPTELDARQWVQVMKSAGMKMVILTVKHHDGFCLWPSKYTEHSVKNSAWKNGKGDVFRELAEACKEARIKLAFYLSPADLHEIEREAGYYGNGSKPKPCVIPSLESPETSPQRTFKYNLDDYNHYFMNQLYELLTEYSDIYEVWFDGANPKPSTGQTYNYQAWYDLIRQLQPNAVIAIKGPDVRWCGNEAGRTRESEWSVLPTPVAPDVYDWPDLMEADLGSRDKLKNTKYLYWYPAETNTSIRHGWFYRDEKQTVKTVDELFNIWLNSVGGNSVLLLNLTPNRRGLIPQTDADRLARLGEILEKTFKRDFAKGATTACDLVRDGNMVRFGPQNTLDDIEDTFWMPDDGQETAEIFFTLKQKSEINLAVIQENIKIKGQRIEGIALDVWQDGKWKKIAQATTVGYKRILCFESVKTDKVRLRITASRVCPTVSRFGLFKDDICYPVPIRNIF